MKILHYLMQVQLLIVRAPLIIPHNSLFEETLRRAEAASWQCLFSDAQLDRYTWLCRWCFFFLIVTSGYFLKNISTASPYLSLLWSLSNRTCKRSSRVSCFSYWHFFEKICHKSEKTLFDSALDNRATIHISRMCNKLQIPKSSPMQKIIGQHCSAWDFETHLLKRSKRIASSSFKWSMQQLLAKKIPLNAPQLLLPCHKLYQYQNTYMIQNQV